MLIVLNSLSSVEVLYVFSAIGLTVCPKVFQLHHKHLPASDYGLQRHSCCIVGMLLADFAIRRVCRQSTCCSAFRRAFCFTSMYLLGCGIMDG